MHTDQFQITQQRSLNIDYGLKIASTDYSHKFAEVPRKVKTVKTLEQINRIERFMSNINKYLLPDPDKKGLREYRVFDSSVEPVNMGVSYAYQRMLTVDDATHFIGLYAAPFLSMKMKIDLVQLLAAYCKVERRAVKCREYIAKGGNAIECYLQLTTAVHLAIGAAYKQQDWTFSAGKENKLGFTLEGVVSVAFKTEVLFVEVALKASATLKTEVGFKLDQHGEGIDLVGYHDGVVADANKRGGIDVMSDTTSKYSYKSKIVLNSCAE